MDELYQTENIWLDFFNQIIVFDKVYKYLSNKNGLDFNLIKKNSIDIKSDIFGLV